MTRNDDFDRTLEAWLRRQAPPQAPDRVLEAALQRAESETQRRGWLHSLAGATPMTLMIRVAAVAAVVAIAAFIGFQFSKLPDNIGASPTPIPSLSAEASESAEPSVAPESASPSAESSTERSPAALVLELSGAGEAGPLHLITILDDGRVISSDPFRVSPPTERRLTAEGIQLVRDEMAATGLTEASAAYQPAANPGKELVYGGAGPVLHIGQAGGDPIVVNWYLFADTELDLAAPQPEAEALEALAARLTTLEEWLPASAWADATAGPFEPDRYFMSIDHQPRQPGDDGYVEVTSVSWPLEEGIDVFGEPSEPPIDAVRYGCLGAADGRAVIEALEFAGAGMLSDQASLVREFVLGNGPDLQYWITVSPVLYDVPPSCQ
jgi:hypothetical protein